MASRNSDLSVWRRGFVRRDDNIVEARERTRAAGAVIGRGGKEGGVRRGGYLDYRGIEGLRRGEVKCVKETNARDVKIEHSCVF